MTTASEQCLVDFIKASFHEFVTETMRDPDIAAQSEEFRAGYEKGVREITGFVVAMIVNRELILNGHPR